MKTLKYLHVIPTVVIAFAVSIFLPLASAKDNVITRFNLKNGAYPTTGLLADEQGNLYGVSPGAFPDSQCPGQIFCGNVYELSPTAGGGWKQTVIYTFQGSPGDGSYPATQLVADSHGNLFGATRYGGANFLGAVFELTPAAGGGWKETIIYSFADGSTPGELLAIDSNGDLFGTLEYSFNAADSGLVFALHRQGDGWSEKSIWQFSGSDGAAPLGGVVLDSKGNIYGTTSQGGTHNLGTVYKLTAIGGGAYTLRSIYSFAGTGDGAKPIAPLALDQTGNLYGVTSNPYFNNQIQEPVAFKLSPNGNTWKKQIVHTFNELPLNAAGTPSGLTLDADGNLYGVTEDGGTPCHVPGCGTLFELSPALGGQQWTHKVIHQFQGIDDGSYPAGNVLFLGGQIFGTTVFGGGTNGYGTVFSVTP